MKVIRLLAKISTTLPAALLFAQSPVPKFKPSFAVSITVEPRVAAIGSKVLIKATIQSTVDVAELAEEKVIGCSFYRVQVRERSGHEPEKTELQRHLLGEFLPGDGPDSMGGSCVGQSLKPGGVLFQTYDLSRYYKLKTPGKYDVTIEMDEDIPNPLRPNYPATYTVRSNVAHFELADNK